MCRRFNFDNTLSLVGAWVMFLLPFYWIIRVFIEWKHDNKYSFKRSFWHTFRESLYELTPSYWWHR